MNYTLNRPDQKPAKPKMTSAVKRLWPFLASQKKIFLFGLVAITITSLAALIAPAIIGRVVDRYIKTGDFNGVLIWAGVLLVIYIVWLVTSFLQTTAMGGVGRRVLFNLRNALFNKLQSLPVAFFNQNKAGDLISRINNDTDQLNQFFAQALIQLLSNLFLIVGAAIFLVLLDIRLGLAALLPAVGVLIITRVISGWVKNRNLKNLQALGGLSAEIQESLTNFKVIVAFNRLDYFRNKFADANTNNFKAAVNAGMANNVFTPIYGLAANVGQLVVLCYGIYLILQGQLTIGLLISFLLYVNNFYTPLRQLAAFWSSLQQALAGIERISQVLDLTNDMELLPPGKAVGQAGAVLEFDKVSFRYVADQDVIKHISFSLEPGKTYALVGPTGGGKTTTASLMARLYDPTEGTIFLNGKDIRSYTPEERVKKIGFILQEPFLFTGTVRDNIVYGNEAYLNTTSAELLEVLKKEGLADLLGRFESGLDTKVSTAGDTISLGQKQLIAFMRATLRRPDLLILDEATANIDTVTEQLLEEILKKLPATTTKVIIAHRLNTISNADAIFFVNAGTVIPAGSMEHAVGMLLKGKRSS